MQPRLIKVWIQNTILKPNPLKGRSGD